MKSIMKKHLKILSIPLVAVFAAALFISPAFAGVFGSDLNEKLFKAAKKGDNEQVEQLINNGASIDNVNKKGVTPLLIAASKGHTDTVLLLIKKGADVNTRASDNKTALMFAAARGHTEIVAALIKNGADIDVKADHRGYTALMWAAAEGHGDIVRVLIENGANVEIKDNYGNRALFHAGNGKHFQVADIIREAAENQEDKKRIPKLSKKALSKELIKAAKNGDLSSAAALIDEGADVDARGTDDWTPLMKAASNGHAAVAKLLIDKGADVEAKNKFGDRALDFANGHGESEIKKVLVEATKEVAAKKAAAEGELMKAAADGDLAKVEALVAGGAEVDAKDKQGYTPLMHAAKEGHMDVSGFLISAGADVSAKNRHGIPPIVYAARGGNLKIVKVLIGKGAGGKGADVNASYGEGWTVLINAVDYGHIEIVKYLLEKGADLEAANDQGTTPLISAAGKRNLKILKLLIDKGADMEAMDNYGRTALDIAIKYKNGGAVKVLEKAAVAAKTAPATATASTAPPSPSLTPTLTSDVDINIPKTGVVNRDAVAVVIGNRDYKNKDIPSVDFAINDALAVKKYLINVLGYDEANILYKPNATNADFLAVFGNNESFDGLLHSYLRKGKSDIFVYYSGHGAPDVKTKQGYFVPTDADPQVIKFTGYSLKLFYENLAKIATDKASPNVYVAIDSCFSGSTEKGMLLKNVSPIMVTVENPLFTIPNSVVMTSATGDEVSSWYPEKKHSMFTYFMLKGLKESAEKGGTATVGEVFSIISDENYGVPYYAKRLNGRFQTPQINGDKERIIIKGK